MSLQTIKPGDTVYVVQRARVVAGRPLIKGVVSQLHNKEGLTFGVSIKVDAGEPKIFPCREVWTSAQKASLVADEYLTWAEHDMLIAYARQRAALEKARSANRFPNVTIIATQD